MMVIEVPSRYTSVTTIMVVTLLMCEVDQIVKLKSKDKYHSDAHLKNCDIIIKVYCSSERLFEYFLYLNII